MKTKIYSYAHEENGLGLELIPETQAENAILEALWKFGRLETCYGGNAVADKCFIVRAFGGAREPK